MRRHRGAGDAGAGCRRACSPRCPSIPTTSPPRSRGAAPRPKRPRACSRCSAPTLLEDAAGPCIVVDRHYPLTHRHGRHDVERYRAAARASRRALPSFLAEDEPGATRSARRRSRRAAVRRRAAALLFFDLETTGLSGGAGTYAFLVGFGYFDGDGFHTRQFFLRGYGEERALLHAVTRQVSAARRRGRRSPLNARRCSSPTTAAASTCR